MLKNDLIKELNSELKELGFSKGLNDTKLIFDTVINTITDNISKGKTVEISNFGIFHSRPVTRINPQDTKVRLTKFSVYFKTSKTIKKKLNEI